MNKCVWNASATGQILVENHDYVASDQMPKTEPNILGGYESIGDGYYCGWVIRAGEKNHLVTRFKPKDAMNDVEKRLRELGNDLEILKPATA